MGDYVLVPRDELEALRDCTDTQMGDGDLARDMVVRWLLGTPNPPDIVIPLRARVNSLIIESPFVGKMVATVTGDIDDGLTWQRFSISFNCKEHQSTLKVLDFRQKSVAVTLILHPSES
jgi:hypothetical protein